MKKVLFPIFFFAAFFSLSLDGQKIRKVISTHENLNRLENLDRSMVRQRANNELLVAEAMNQNRTFKEKTIAVVFHVLYTNEKEKISKSDVLKQIEVLNNDFSGSNRESVYPGAVEPRFRNRSTNPQLKFCFPAIDDDRLSVINYIKTDKAEWDIDDLMKSTNTGGADPWSTDKFLNIWVANLANKSSGYAQMPGGRDETDGIVIDTDFFYAENNPGDFSKGRTLTHLVGNYLGLYSLWGNGECEDDLVEDTPIHSSPNHSCGSDLHVSFCGKSGFEMPMNFMDSTPDDCQSMFTFGQKRRIHAFLSVTSLRGKLADTPIECNSDLLLEEGEEFSLEQAKNKLSSEGISIFPNPTRKDISVHFFQDYGDGVSVRLIDLNGRTISEINGLNAQVGSISLRLGVLSPGTYYLSFSKNGASFAMKRLMVTP